MSEFESKGVSPLEGEGLRGDGQAKWYVIHTYSGHENKVKVNIEKMVENRGMQDLILDIVVPTEDRVEIKDGQRKIKTRKMFPGYVIIKMIVTNESWYLVRNTQGVTGFVGPDGKPVPLTADEVRKLGIEETGDEEGSAKTVTEVSYSVGDFVTITEGLMEGNSGVVETIDTDNGVVRVIVSFMGKEAPIELPLNQVKKAID